MLIAINPISIFQLYSKKWIVSVSFESQHDVIRKCLTEHLPAEHYRVNKHQHSRVTGVSQGLAFQLEKPCGCQAVGMTAANRHLNPSRVEEEQKSSQYLVVTVAVNTEMQKFLAAPLPFLPSLPSATFTSHFHVPVVKE